MHQKNGNGTFTSKIGFVLAARALGWPVYPELRRAFAAALQPEQSLLLGEERGLLRFTEQTAQELADTARSMWEDVTATPETARKLRSITQSCKVFNSRTSRFSLRNV